MSLKARCVLLPKTRPATLNYCVDWGNYNADFIQWLLPRQVCYCPLIESNDAWNISEDDEAKTCAVESGGYIVRALSVRHVANKDLYITQFALVVLAPVLMAAACYVIFVRLQPIFFS